VPMGPSAAEAAPSAAEEDKVLPEWSEKVAQGILTGKPGGLISLNKAWIKIMNETYLTCLGLLKKYLMLTKALFILI